jgi:hypothetical protein
LSGPQYPFKQKLEAQLQSEHGLPSIARKHALRLVEVRIRCIYVAQIRVSSRSERLYVIYTVASTRITSRNVLGMVQDVAKLRSEAELDAFSNANILVNTQINVTDKGDLEESPL